METTIAHMPSYEMDKYHQTALRRQSQEQAQLAHFREKAWETARRAAGVLRERFHISRVVVFGSLVHEGCFTRWSDIDIAVWGISSEDTFRAVGAAIDVSDEFVVNLVDINIVRPSLLEIIDREGVEI
jgi:uncharacterized protein